MSELHFAEPQWVHLLWAVAAFAGLLAWLERRGTDALARFVGTALQPRLLRGPSRVQRGLRIGFLGLSGLFLTLALMRPQWGLELVSTPRAGAEIMICLDVSRSMLAEDVAPNRLDRAKAEVRDLLGYLDGDQVGLIAFAGRAAVLSPLTPDFGFLRLALDNAGPHTVGRGGTRLEEPVRKAIAGFGDTGDVSRSILLITDGEDHDSFPLEAARDAAERGIGIIAIGFGDEAGSEITITDRETGSRTQLRDADGHVVRSRLDGELLRELALATGGAYVPAGTGALDLESIFQRHLAPLTRGRLDGRSRAVRNDAYQWAVLLGLLALIGAVASTARPASARTGAGTRTLSSVVGPSLLGLALWTSPWPGFAPAAQARAQTPPAAAAAPTTETEPRQPGARVPAVGDPDPGPATGDAPAPEAPAPEPEIPENAREAYNLGIELLGAQDTAQASRVLSAARERAGNDGEVRFRATYNLGWAEVDAADAAIEAEPEKALEHLNRAADWFQEAVRLRAAHEDSRYNLETVTRRALELADSLAEHGQADVGEELDRLIAAQRAFLSELRAGVAASSSDDQPGATPESRRALRRLASSELTVLADADGLNTKVVRELEVLEGKSEDEREPEDRLRAAQLDALLGYLNRARERLAQTRTRLRRLQGKRAYRRASSGLGALQRARDQLLDPVARLDALLAEGLEISRQTGLALASNAVPGEPGAAISRPPWLTRDYLTGEQSELEARTAELHDGLQSGLESEGAAAGTEPGESRAEPPSPDRERLLSQLREATPLIEAARDEFTAASGALAVDGYAEALSAQRRALDSLASARERFLDLRRLIELVYAQEAGVQGALAAHWGANAGERAAASGAASGGEAGATAAPERFSGEAPAALAIDEIASLLAPAHGRNLERMARLGAMITDAAIEAGQGQSPAASSLPTPTAPPAGENAEQMQYERAFEQWRAASDAMYTAQDKLDALDSGAARAETDARALAETAAGSVDTAVAALEDLRRLFFGLLEHLQETARRQQALADETEEVAALDDPANADATARRAGPLGPRQAALTEMAGTIAEGLREQATAGAGTPPGDGAPQASPPEEAARLERAAELVATARTSMSQALEGLEGKPPDLEVAREEQDQALAGLAEAIALLGRPPEQPPEGGEDQQSDDEPQQGGQDQQAPSQEPQSTDLAQLLQGVRDREAQRQEARAQGRDTGYEPVEKDW